MKTKWTTRDGTKIRIKDMTTSHIKNTLGMLNRIADQNLVDAHNFISLLHGDQAIYSMEQEIDRMENGEFGELTDYVEAFEDELGRRGEQ